MRNVVLVAHPSPDRREALTEQLTGAGYNVLSSATGHEALATAARYVPQLAVVHVDLPEVQGTDVCLRLKQEAETKQIAVLLLGAGSAEERFVVEEVGADAYLTEPAEADAVVARVRELFRSLTLNAR